MATPQLAETNVRWREAVVKIDDSTSMRVQYLASRSITDYGQLADLVAKGYDFGRVWVVKGDHERAYAEASRRAIDMLRDSSESEILSTKGMVRRATQAELRKYGEASRERIAEAAASVGRAAVEAIVESGERVASMLPISTGRVEREREEMARRRRQRPAEVVAETARGEEAEVETGMAPIELPEREEEKPEEAVEQAPELRRGQATVQTIPHFTGTRGHGYQFEIIYDRSKIGGDVPVVGDARLADARFFDQPENRGAIVRFRYRTVDGGERGEWTGWIAGKNYHDRYVTRTKSSFGFEVRDPNGEIISRFSLYFDPDKVEDMQHEVRAIETATNPIEMLKALQATGNISGFSTPSGGVWVRGDLLDFLAALERTYDARERRGLKFTRT